MPSIGVGSSLHLRHLTKNFLYKINLKNVTLHLLQSLDKCEQKVSHMTFKDNFSYSEPTLGIILL
jgi:hypothetical protein